jgi:hypothetical protein
LQNPWASLLYYRSQFEGDLDFCIDYYAAIIAIEVKTDIIIVELESFI